MGLMSDGGVYLYIEYFIVLVLECEKFYKKVCLYLIIDGRDVVFKSVLIYLK